MKRLEKNDSKSLYLYLIRANFKDKKPFQSSYGIALESIIKKGLETLKVKLLLKGHYITMGLGQSYNMYQTSYLQKKSNFFHRTCRVLIRAIYGGVQSNNGEIEHKKQKNL